MSNAQAHPSPESLVLSGPKRLVLEWHKHRVKCAILVLRDEHGPLVCLLPLSGVEDDQEFAAIEDALLCAVQVDDIQRTVVLWSAYRGSMEMRQGVMGRWDKGNSSIDCRALPACVEADLVSAITPVLQRSGIEIQEQAVAPIVYHAQFPDADPGFSLKAILG